jgi:CHAD domain-containing protein
MPDRPSTVVFAVGPEIDIPRLARWLPGLTPAGPPRSTDRTLYDTFDGRLHRRGLTLWRAGPSSGGSFELDGFPGTLPVTGPSGVGGSLLAADLSDNVAGQRLRDALAERAAMPLVRVRGRHLPLKVCDGEGKTVVRLMLDEPEVVRRGHPPVVMERRLLVTPVLGYQRDLERVLTALRRRLTETDRPASDEAMAAAGLDPRGVSSDVAVRLRPSMRAERATALICRRLADVVEANLPGVLDDTDSEFLHDLRVAVRRTRSVVKEMSTVLSPDDLERARVDLRWIQEVTGPTRDLDVLLLSWPTMSEPVPASMQPDLAPLVTLLQSHRDEAFRAMRRHLRSRRYAMAWARWRQAVDTGAFDGDAAATPVADLAGRRVATVYKRMVAMGSAISDDSPPEALHDMRKKGKELRYLFELFGSLWPAEEVKPLVSALKGLQDELGHFQDDEIQVAELRSLGPALAAAPGGTDSLIALGFVIEGLTSRQQQARAAFSRRFAAFAAPETRRVVRGFGGTK